VLGLQRVELSDSLLTIEEAAKALSVTPGAVRKWLHQRRLRPVKVGRLTRLRKSDVAAIVQDGLPALAKVVARPL